LEKNLGIAHGVTSKCIGTFWDANGLKFPLGDQTWINPAGDTKSILLTSLVDYMPDNSTTRNSAAL
jgi:hypothetical protein